MLFADWFFFTIMAVGVIFIIVSAVGVRFAGKMPRSPKRIALLVICLPLGAIAFLGVVLMAAGSGRVTHSPPIYSPSGKMAARIENADEELQVGAHPSSFFGHTVSKRKPFILAGESQLSLLRSRGTVTLNS